MFIDEEEKELKRKPTRSGCVEQRVLRLFSANAGNVAARTQRQAHVVGDIQRLNSLGDDVVEEVAILQKYFLAPHHTVIRR